MAPSSYPYEGEQELFSQQISTISNHDVRSVRTLSSLVEL
jgi:hypothetical protein